jgi:hypothetical protein
MNDELVAKQRGKFLVTDYPWEPTPRWLQWFGYKPFRQFHLVHYALDPLDWYSYADQMPVSK